MSTSITLRKLSWKSIIDFGKYNGMSVRQIYDLKHTAYLRWIYYNFDGLSFVDEILKEIHIYDQWMITKPGKDPDKFQKLCDLLFAKNMDKDPTRGAKIVSKVRKDQKIEQLIRMKMRRYSETKGYLQRKNQGKL